MTQTQQQTRKSSYRDYNKNEDVESQTSTESRGQFSFANKGTSRANNIIDSDSEEFQNIENQINSKMSNIGSGLNNLSNLRGQFHNRKQSN